MCEAVRYSGVMDKAVRYNGTLYIAVLTPH
jgi:hypothetical protein